MNLSFKRTAPWLAMSIAALSLTACFENSETATTTNTDPKAQAREELAKVQLTDAQTANALKGFATQDSVVWSNSTSECQKAAIAVQAGLFDKQKAWTLCSEQWIDIVAKNAVKNGDVSSSCEADYKILMQNMVSLQNEYSAKCQSTVNPTTKDSLQMQSMMTSVAPYTAECNALVTKIQSLKEKIGASCVSSGTGIEVIIPFDSNKVDYNLCSQLEYKLKTVSASCGGDVACYEKQKSIYAMDASLANCPILAQKDTSSTGKICPTIWAPVCGVFEVYGGLITKDSPDASQPIGSYTKTFSNECEAQAAGVVKLTAGICKSDSVFVDPKDSVTTADSTSTACPDIYAPVCGNFLSMTANGTVTYMTFPNECTLKAKGAIFKSVGECPQDSTTNITVCPSIYEPICGVSAVNGTKVYTTYSNECEVKKAGAIVSSVGVCPATDATNSGTSSSGTLIK